MPEFKPNVPVVSAVPNVTVDVTAASPLPVGAHQFQLVVVDDSANVSQPALLRVIVRDTQAPTAVLEMVNVDGATIAPIVSAGADFNLSGAKSADLPPGKIVEYRFTLIS